MNDRDRTLYEERPMPPEPWTHEDNPDWVFVESYPVPYMLVPVVPAMLYTVKDYGDRRIMVADEVEKLPVGRYALVRIGEADDELRD